MKKKTVKVAIYSFIISFLALLLIMNREIITEDINGLTSMYTKSYSEFFFEVFLYSIGITLVITIISLIISWLRKKSVKK